jgi:hypothetical protein
MSNEKMHEGTENSNPVVELLPDGAALVRVDGAELHFASAGECPRVRDLDLAGWLGFERPRKVRELVRRMEGEGKLAGVNWRPTMGRQPVGPGGKGVREFETLEAWLTREEALLVATQSGTPRAWAITRIMVRVFDAVLQRAARSTPATAEFGGLLEAAVRMAIQSSEQRHAEQIARLEAHHERAIAAMVHRVEALETSVATGVVGREVADREILTPLRQISLLYGGTPGEARRHRRRLENKLRSFLGFAGPGSGWAFLPRSSLAFAQRLLGPWMTDAVEVGTKRSLASQQPDLFGLHEPGRPMRGTRSPAN